MEEYTSLFKGSQIYSLNGLLHVVSGTDLSGDVKLIRVDRTGAPVAELGRWVTKASLVGCEYHEKVMAP